MQRAIPKRSALAAGLSVITGLMVPPGSADALTMEQQEFVCPIGGGVFTAQVVMSYSQFGSRFDLRPIGALVAPIPLPVCPSNGFVMYSREFTDEELTQLADIVASSDFQAARAVHSDYYMVAYMRERLGASDYTLGHTYLSASWEVEDQAGERPAQYLGLALAAFDRFLVDAVPGDDWWTAQILSANLLRRLGRFAEADARLSALPVDDLPPGPGLRSVISQLAALIDARDPAPREIERE